jgi:microcystin degradation protein MlrC
MRIFIAGLDTETNTFAPWPTGLQGFYREVAGSTEAAKGLSVAGQLVRLWNSLAHDAGHEPTPSWRAKRAAPAIFRLPACRTSGKSP